jgi:hypothetical protein
VRPRHRGQGRRASCPDTSSPGVLLLPVRWRGPVPADQAGRVQAHLARRVDQYLLRAPVARRADGRQRAPAAAARARDRHGRSRASAAQIPLPGPDGQRRGGERGLPRVRGVLGRGDGPGPGGGRRDRMGGLGSVLRCGKERAAIGLAVVCHAGRRARRAGSATADLASGRRCGPASGGSAGRVIRRLTRPRAGCPGSGEASGSWGSWGRAREPAVPARHRARPPGHGPRPSTRPSACRRNCRCPCRHTR